MKPAVNQLTYYTPYIIFTFGLILSLIGFFLKLAVSRMEKSFDRALLLIEKHSDEINKILLTQNTHELKITWHSEVLKELQKSKLEPRSKAGKVEEDRF